MKDRYSDKRYRVNFNNSRIKLFTSALAISENRMSRERFDEICTKDNFYTLLHSKLIEVDEDGIISSTAKLRGIASDKYDIHFSSSCSDEHSAKVADSLHLIPQSVLTDFHFRTANDIERDYERDLAFSEGETRYEANLQKMREEFFAEQEAQRNYYEQKIAEEQNQQQQALLRLEWERAKEDDLVYAHALESDKPFLIPEIEISVTRSELHELNDNMRSELPSIEEERERDLFSESINKLENVEEFEGRITISVEIITDSYHNAEIVKHEIYEGMTGTIQIMI